MKALLLGLFLAVAATTTSESAESYTVIHSFVCRLDAAVAIAEKADAGADNEAAALATIFQKSGDCKVLPRPVRMYIIEITDGPFRNESGSMNGRFYVVKVGSKGWYTFAWPGKNSDYPVGKDA